jgi:hypothetical protein
VLDNLGEGVLTPDIYDPALNPLYRDVLAHYGIVALPCRVGDPDRKSSGGFIRRDTRTAGSSRCASILAARERRRPAFQIDKRSIFMPVESDISVRL